MNVNIEQPDVDADPAERVNERFSARLTSGEKALLERAAAIEGRSLTDFILSNARKAAETTVREHDLLLLSVKAGEAFAAALAREPAVVPSLRDALKRNPQAANL